ncbi:hypothetical protein NN561_004443 [Cricetulus griseus]
MTAEGHHAGCERTRSFAPRRWPRWLRRDSAGGGGETPERMEFPAAAPDGGGTRAIFREGTASLPSLCLEAEGSRRALFEDPSARLPFKSRWRRRRRAPGGRHLVRWPLAAPRGRRPPPSRAHLHLPGTAPEPRIRGTATRTRRSETAVPPGCTEGRRPGMASFFVVGMGVVGSRNTLQDHVGHRSVTMREAGRECALGRLCCHRLLLEHLLSANLSPTRPLLTLLRLHWREEGGLVLRELRAEDPEWLAPTPGVSKTGKGWGEMEDRVGHSRNSLGECLASWSCMDLGTTRPLDCSLSDTVTPVLFPSSFDAIGPEPCFFDLLFC